MNAPVTPFVELKVMDRDLSRTQQYLRFRNNRLEMMRRIAETCEDAVRLKLPAQHVLAANGPEILYDVLVGKAKSFEKSPVLRIGLFPLAGYGLFTSEGELWKRQRRLMAPLFRRKELKRYAEDMAVCARRGCDDWHDGDVVDIARETTRIAMSVAGKTLFDADTFSDADELGEALSYSLDWVNAQIGTPVLIGQAQLRTKLLVWGQRAGSERLRALCQRGVEVLETPVILPGKRKDELQAALAVLERRVDAMIADRMQGGEAGGDLLAALLAARDEDGSAMSKRQVRDEILTLFIAGHETTASGLAWSLVLLTQHPEAYARAQAEVDALGDVAIGLEHVAALPYCLQVFKEALRLYPPIYLFGRQAIEPVTVGGIALETGTIVLVCPYSIQRRPDLWPDPERFDPDRFTPEREKGRPREAFIPFSDGPRTCIGNHFALMEAPIVLATLLQKWRFELVNAPVPEASATLRPGGAKLRVERRT